MSRRGAAKKSKARLLFIRAKYQKTEREGTLTGSVYARGVPSYGYNEQWKEKTNAKLLNETMKFNTELNLYTGKVNSPEQAIMLRDAAKEVCEADEVAPPPAASRAFEHMPSVLRHFSRVLRARVRPARRQKTRALRRAWPCQ